MADGKVVFEIRADDGKVVSDLKNTVNKFGALGQKVDGATKSITQGLGISGTAAIAAVGAAALKCAQAVAQIGMEFEAQMSKVQAISGATAAELELLNEQALQLGADTAFSASEAAAGMENLASAGFTVEETMAAMPGMLDLAAAGAIEVSQAAEIAAASVNIFNLAAEDTGHVADVLAKAAAMSNAGVSDMGEALANAGPVAASLGMSIEETAAAISIMADAGIKGGRAGTALQAGLLQLTKPTEDVAAAMKKLGINAGQDLATQIEILQRKTANMTEEQRTATLAMLYGRTAVAEMSALVNAEAGELDRLTEEYENSTGAAKEMADVMMDNVKGAFDGVTGALQTIAVRAFEFIATPLQQFLETIGNLLTTVGDLFGNLFDSIGSVLDLTEADAGWAVFLLILDEIAVAVGIVADAFSIVAGILQLIIEGIKWITGNGGDFQSALDKITKPFTDKGSTYNAAVNAVGNFKENTSSTVVGQVVSGFKGRLSNGQIVTNEAVYNAMKAKGYASGATDFPGGWGLVGENGPEVVRLPQHSQIFTNEQSQAMMGKQGATIGSLTINPNAQQWGELMNLLSDTKTSQIRGRAK